MESIRILGIKITYKNGKEKYNGNNFTSKENKE